MQAVSPVAYMPLAAPEIMRSRFLTRMMMLILSGFLCLQVQPVAAQTSTTRPTPVSKKKKSKHSKSSKKSKTRRKRGQQAIDSDRAREIQEALVKQHYMTGEPSGHWDAATEAALRKFQGDQGWQTKTVPDSRALIKLGLGPSKDGLLNPESAMTMPSASADSKPSSNGSAGESKPQP